MHCISLLKPAFQFLIDNTYVRVGKEIFRQQVGILMGTDCVHCLANLFLFYFQNNYMYMKDLIKSNILNSFLILPDILMIF